MQREELRSIAGQRKFFIAGYILRIIPFAEAIGYILTGIGWYRVYRVRRVLWYIISAITLLALALSTVAVYVDQFIVHPLPINLPPPTQETPSLAVVEQFRDAVHNQSIGLAMSLSVYRLAPQILAIIALVMEALAFTTLPGLEGKFYRWLVPVLLILIAGTTIAVIASIAYTLNALQVFEKELNETIARGEVAQSTVIELYWRYLSSQMLLLATSMILLIVKIIGGLFAALAFRYIGKVVVEKEVLSKAPEVPPPSPP